MTPRPLANTGLLVSPLCLGTMTFGTPVAADDAVRLVHWALDHGINFFDTADIYEGYARVMGSPGGVAETILGQALAGRRHSAIITTKVGNPVGPGPLDKGLSRVHITHQIDVSLHRMGTTYVDLYELHKPDPETPLEESVATMAGLIAAGKVRHWGFSNFATEQVLEMVALCDRHGWPPPVASQPHYNWLERGIEKDHLPACHELDIAVTPYQPLQAGLLTGKYRRGQPKPAGSRAAEHARWLADIPDATFDKLEAFEREAAAAGLAPARDALRWLLDQPGITSVVAGVKSIDQLEALLPGLPVK